MASRANFQFCASHLVCEWATKQLLSGKVRLLVTDTPVATAKMALDLAKAHGPQFVVLGGCYEGAPLNQALIKQIASLPVDDAARVVQQFGALVTLMRNSSFMLARSLASHKQKLNSGLFQVKLLKEKEDKASVASSAPAPAASAATAATPAAAPVKSA